MKYLKHIVGIAAVTLAPVLVCPFITSCSLASVKWKTSDGQFFPSVPPKQGRVRKADLTNTYFHDINERSIIFAEDLMRHIVGIGNDEQVDLQQYTITVNSINVEQKRVSFSFHAQCLPIESNDVTKVLIIDKVYKNIPIFVTETRFIDTLWEKKEQLWADNNWSLFYSLSLTGKQDRAWNLNSKVTSQEEKEIAEEELVDTYFSSYYFSKIIIE